MWHVAFVVLVLPLSQYIPDPPRAALPRVQITWYGPIDDLPLLIPRAPTGAPKAPTGAPRAQTERSQPVRQPEQTPLPQHGADAFHPRQTVVNTSMRPNHPRQTLIQPAAPMEPPTILPNLPNIVMWDNPNEPQAPRIDPAILRLKQPKAAERLAQREIEAPEAPRLEQPLGPIDLVASAASKPTLPVEAMSAPKTRAQQAVDVTAPEIVAQDGNAQLIALSATPEPEQPVEIPVGNLSAHLTISPEGVGPGAANATIPAAAPTITGNGPPGLRISGGSGIRSNTSGTGGLRVMPGIPGRPPAAAPPPVMPGVVASRSQPSSMLNRIQPRMLPEALLGPKRIYTMRFSMANLSSATGSWVLNFSELVTMTARHADPDEPELRGPTALRKVDPKYPPELRDKHVEGEVVLYAVIRAGGTVDSIQLVQGIDPTLDANAMQALAQWKFKPAERLGQPVDIETVVRIPFRAATPLY
jgi:TonB family protein